MSDTKLMLVGIDLGTKETQISCFDRNTYETVSVGYVTGEERNREYAIPTALRFVPESGSYLFMHQNEEEGGVVIDRLIDRIRDDADIEIDGYHFEKGELLKRFLVKCLSILGEYYPDQTIKYLVITTRDSDQQFREMLQTVCAEIGIGEDRLTLQTYRQSYMYYAVSQPKELWLNNVGLFEFDEEGLYYSQINIDRRTIPWIIGVKQRELTDVLDVSMIENAEFDVAYAFANLAENVLHKQMVTTVYFTGDGFTGEWVNEALQRLCNGRRIFQGDNLFTRGACYAAREIAGEGKLEQCMFLDEEMISVNIAIRMYQDAQIQDVVLAKAGSIWEDVDESVDLIPDAEYEMQVIVQDMIRHETKMHMLSLAGIMGRGNKMTRFTIRIRFANKDTCVITLKDNGFGEICPTSNRIWERCIKV